MVYLPTYTWILLAYDLQNSHVGSMEFSSASGRQQ